MNKFINTENKINEIIEKKYFSGAVVQICKDKQVLYKNCFGLNDIDNNLEMKEDLIFRAYSMTKPITVIAFLLLVDKGLIKIEDKVSDYLPEFKNLKVLKDIYSEEITDCKNEITFFNLLTMTSGLTYSGNKTLTQRLTSKVILNFWKSDEGKFWDYKKFISELTKVPLLYEPGTNWKYGLSLDVIAATIETITKQSFRDFVVENIFKPLDMNSSDFYMFDKSREANIYEWRLIDDKPILKKYKEFNFLQQTVYSLPPLVMGGAGLFTTTGDYSKFLNFLLDGKDKNDNQLLNYALIELMKSDQLKELGKYFDWNLNEDYTYGFGVRVRTQNVSYPLTCVNEFGWDGLLGSTGLVDPDNKITMCLMLSSKPGHNKLIETEFFEALYKDLKKL